MKYLNYLQYCECHCVHLEDVDVDEYFAHKVLRPRCKEGVDDELDF